MKEKGESHLNKFELAKVAAARVSMEVTPFFANFGLTENAIVGAGLLTLDGKGIIPGLLAISAARSYFVKRLVNMVHEKREREYNQ